MAYNQIVRALRRSLQQKYRATQVGYLVHTHRTVSTVVSMPTFHRRTEAPISLLPTLCCINQANTARCFSVDFRLRNKISSGDRDKSVSRFQGGSPASSAAQKGTEYSYVHIIYLFYSK